MIDACSGCSSLQTKGQRDTKRRRLPSLPRHLVIPFSPVFATGPDGSSRRAMNRIAACGASTYNYDLSARLVVLSQY